MLVCAIITCRQPACSLSVFFPSQTAPSVNQGKIWIEKSSLPINRRAVPGFASSRPHPGFLHVSGRPAASRRSLSSCLFSGLMQRDLKLISLTTTAGTLHKERCLS